MLGRDDQDRLLSGVEKYLDALERESPLLMENVANFRPRYYHRDGKPIRSNELAPDFMQWAMLFETSNRVVIQTHTLYGERLSTVWLGMDQSFFAGPPLIFETMLFAPRKHTRWILAPEEKKEEARAAFETEDEYIKIHFPHDQLQCRYRNEEDAHEGHEKLMMQCLVPPRWRKFLFYTIGRDTTWS